jgi:hypothetical protein
MPSCSLPDSYQSFIGDSIQKMEAVGSSETSVNFHQTTRKTPKKMVFLMFIDV